MSSRTYFTMKNIVDNNFKVETLRLRFSAASTDVQRFEEFFHDILATKFFGDEIRIHNGIDIEKPTGLVNTLQN